MKGNEHTVGEVADKVRNVLSGNLREDKEGCADFLNTCTCWVVGKENWKASAESKDLSKLATPGCEAMALLCLENVLDSCEKEAMGHGDDESCAVTSGEGGLGDKRRRKRSERATACTKGASWTEEGKKRFNELRAVVVADRREHQDHDAWFANRMRALSGDRAGKKRKKSNDGVATATVVQNDFEFCEAQIN